MNTHKIVTSKPISKEAALVTGPGIHYTPKMPRVPQLLYKNCPETFGFGYRFNKKNPDFRKKRFGRFIAVGISTEHGRWVMKCSCGNYEFRSAKALKNYENNPHKEYEFMCQYCLQEIAQKNKQAKFEIWVASGSKKREEEQEGE